jgi:hypothetical protein
MTRYVTSIPLGVVADSYLGQETLDADTGLPRCSIRSRIQDNDNGDVPAFWSTLGFSTSMQARERHEEIYRQNGCCAAGELADRFDRRSGPGSVGRWKWREEEVGTGWDGEESDG